MTERLVDKIAVFDKKELRLSPAGMSSIGLFIEIKALVPIYSNPSSLFLIVFGHHHWIILRTLNSADASSLFPIIIWKIFPIKKNVISLKIKSTNFFTNKN